jgi:hypothetical protein
MTYLEFVSDPIFRQFTTTDPDRQALITQIYQESECEEDPATWLNRCDFRLRAIKYLTAHKLTIIDRLQSGAIGNTSAQVSAGIPRSISVSDNSQSISFEVPKASDVITQGNYTDTLWGIQYLQLKRKGAKKFVAAIVP